MEIKVIKEKIEDITGTELFYKYKNIRMYRLIKGDHYQTYWVSILILDEIKGAEVYKGKLLRNVDIRTLPGFKEKNISGYQLITEPQKIIPNLFRTAVKQGFVTEDMYIDWDETMSECLIDEI